MTIDYEMLVDFALRLIGQDSLSGNEAAAGRIVAAEMRRLGFDVSMDDWGNVIGRMSNDLGPVVLFDAHMDTVPWTSSDQWRRNPRGEIRDGRLYGRGAVDMKGALSAMIYGIASLHDDSLPGTAILCASVVEEWIEGSALVHVCQKFPPHYVVIGEATNLTLAIAQKGRAEVVIDIEGVPAHSSRPHLGVNAADLMSDVVRALRKIEMPSHPLLGNGLLVLTDLVSSPSPALSTIPAKCRAIYDRRLIPGEQPDRVLAPIKDTVSEVLAGTGARWSVAVAHDAFTTHTGVQFTRNKWAPAWETNTATDCVAASLRALSQVDLVPAVSTYSFCTNGSGSAGPLGIPTVGFGPGDPDLAHQIDESVSVDDLIKAAQGYGALARELMSVE